MGWLKCSGIRISYLVIPESLAAESRSRRDWNRFLDRHNRRKWNVRESKVMDKATHVAMYFGFYLKKPPVAISRLQHYAGCGDYSDKAVVK